MAVVLKGLALGPIKKQWLDNINSQLSDQVFSIEWTLVENQADDLDLEKFLHSYDFSVIGGESCLNLHKVVKHRSVDSHFLSYMDFVTINNSQLWGHSLFSGVFRESMLKAIENQDFKGPVIFLGGNPYVLPTLDILARFGFEDFVFLKLDNSAQELSLYDKYISSILKTKMSTVNSTAFIRSQKEYSFCFVMEDNYSPQTLEDMSYFHFLSTQSLVFDLSGHSNFLFKEVRALGVDVVDYELIQAVKSRHLIEKLKNIASSLS